jgi:heme/copper-type cytochrome/quinol oxidase subunit 2
MRNNNSENFIADAFNALGPWGPCLALFVAGCLFIAGFCFNWQWLSPSRAAKKNHDPQARRFLFLVTGIILLFVSGVFYVFRVGIQ